MNDKVVVSVITVCRNNRANLEKTIESVVSQDFLCLEFIVIDGASTDGTLDLLEEYRDSIDVLVSESDTGIYNAMNKGISIAKGKWLIFMNAGDSFFSIDTLTKIQFTKFSSSAIIYGATERDGKRITYPLDTDRSLRMGFIMACHQSMLFNKELLREELWYSEKYNLSDDYDLVSRIYNAGYALTEVDMPISRFLGGGATTHRIFSTRLGRYKAIYYNFGFYTLVSCLVRRALGNKTVNPRVEYL